jgi:EF hand
MRKTIIAGLGALVLTALLSGCARDRMMQHGAMHGGGAMMGQGSSGAMMGGMGMQAMDANKDGMVSREEFMNHHAAMYDRMPKNRSGMVDMAEMHKGMHSPPKSP